jgi:Protein kinase domain
MTSEFARQCHNRPLSHHGACSGCPVFLKGDCSVLPLSFSLTAASPESFNGKFCSQRGVAASAVLPSNARHWLNEPLLKQCVAEIAEALHDLHSRNMVHLDVKPANILVQFSDRYSGPLSLNSDGNIVRDVESDGVVITFKLGDFGLACSIYEPCPEDGDGSYLSWSVSTFPCHVWL